MPQLECDDAVLGDFHTDLSVGDILRRARLKKGLDVEDLGYAIRVSASHIIAIEEGRFGVLPGRTYALGFIRAYAEYVGIDGDKIIGLLKRQSGEVIAPKDITPNSPSTLEDYALPTGKMFAVIIALLLITIGFKSFYHGNAYLLNDNIPPLPQELKTQTTLLTKPEKKSLDSSVTVDMTVLNDLPKAAANQPENQPENQIVLKAMENVWIDIRDANRKTIFSRVLQTGEEYWIPTDQTGLTMTMGNAGGLQITLGGQVLPPLGKTGQVIRNFVLDREKLKQNLKIEPEKAM